MKNTQSQHVKGYYIGPPVHVLDRMYNGGKVTTKFTEPNYSAENYNQIWKTNEEDMTKEHDDNRETFEDLAKTGLWITKRKDQKEKNEYDNLPVSEQIKQKYNSDIAYNALTYGNSNFESTNDTSEFNHADQTQKSREPNTPGFANTYDANTPSFGLRQQNENVKSGFSKTSPNERHHSKVLTQNGFRMTFNDK